MADDARAQPAASHAPRRGSWEGPGKPIEGVKVVKTDRGTFRVDSVGRCRRCGGPVIHVHGSPPDVWLHADWLAGGTPTGHAALPTRAARPQPKRRYKF